MGVFCVLLFVPLIMQHFVVKQSYIDYEKKNKRALTVFFIIYAVLLTLRHEFIGNDTGNYIHFFGIYSSMGWKELAGESALGFAYFNKIVSLFTENAQIFLAVSAAITLTMIYPTYRRLCEDSSLTIVLFCTMSTFVMMFSGIRQMLAVGIGFLAYECTRKKKPLFFLILIILAQTVHASAIALIIMYPLYHTKITKKWLYAVVPLLIAALVFNNQIFSILGMILERFTGYDASIVRTGAYMMLILFTLFAVFAFFIPEESLLDQETIGLRNFLLFSIVIQMFASLHTVAMRISYYYIMFIPLLIPKIVSCRSEKWKQFAIVGRHVMVVFFLMYFFWNARSGGSLHTFPYHFFWERV